MDILSLHNPVFITYLIAGAIMILKLMAQGWVTVYWMIRTDAGLLNPEDLQKGPANRNPRREQLAPKEEVERSRRIHRNDLENIPAFLICGLLFVLTQPSLLLTQILMYVFVVSRLAHTLAYSTRQRHELRAALFSVGSIIVVVMTIYVLIAAFSAGPRPT